MPVVVNGEVIDDAVIREEARLMRPQYEATITGLDPVAAEMQLREWARDNVIDRVLLRQEALRDPEPPPDPVMDAAVEQMRTAAGGQIGCGTRTSDADLRREAETRWRIDRLLARIESGIARPRKDEIAQFYRKNQDRFYTEELVHAKHIVKNVDERQDEAAARAGIDQAEGELRAGAAFEDVADRLSDCPGRGGDLGYFPRGQMVDEFDAVVFALEPGATSPIFRTMFGFHIARVYDRKPAGLRPLAEVREQIAAFLFQEKREAAIADFLDKARERAVILTGSRVSA